MQDEDFLYNALEHEKTGIISASEQHNMKMTQYENATCKMYRFVISYFL